MSLDGLFEVAAGSVAGRSHVLAGKPNQDAFAFRKEKDGLACVVCDGCGSGAHNEVGASIGARVVVEQVLSEIEGGANLDSAATWERLRERVLFVLSGLARAMGVTTSKEAAEFFLFTVVGLAVSRERAYVFGIGDGLFAFGREIVKLGPFPGNAPPYLGYGLFGEGPRFSVFRALDVSALDSALIGTDGAADYVDLEGAPRPGGRGQLVPPIASFWAEDRYFQNEDALRRTLSLINREVTRPLWAERRLEKEAGLLEDDTTILVLRRRKL